uniref:Uncharacterized protein n=1 Tax=Panagrolaimus davidi TaxID=227884 RepID=A0A914PT16_9BILA
MESICEMYTLQSNDNKVFQVNQKVIDASVLLKNSCELTDITEPILLNCSSKCLDAFVQLINHYDKIIDIHDTEFEIELFESFNRDDLGKLVEQIGYLDSDFFVETIADVILDRINGFDWKELQAYFDLEDDFTEDERYQIEDNKFEFLISLAARRLYLRFPLSPSVNFMMLKNFFFTPMNVIFSKIIEKSNEKTSFNLSVINKSIKNEVDRYPIKITEFQLNNRNWSFQNNGKPKFSGSVTHASYNEKYLQIFIQRKISPYSLMVIENGVLSPTTNIPKFVLNNFVVIPKAPTLTLKVMFSQWIKLSNCFDIHNFSSLFFKIDYIDMNFNLFYQRFILKDLSKEIQINASCADFKFFNGGVIYMFKKANCSKFHEIYITSKIQKISAEFKNFVLEFMEEDGIIRSRKKIFKINSARHKVKKEYVFKVSTVKEILIGL